MVIESRGHGGLHASQTRPCQCGRGFSSCPGLLERPDVDDVTILPDLTDVRPDQVSLQAEVIKGVRAALPVFSAAMETVWSVALTCSLAEFGAIGPITQELSQADLLAAIEQISRYRIDLTRFPEALHIDGRPPILVAASPFEHSKLDFLLVRPEVDYVIINTVQPFHVKVLETVEKYSVLAPDKLVVGNLATAEAAYEFCRFPIAALKVGLGPGSICTTREMSGVGVPQLEAIQEVASVARPVGIPVIADGGIRIPGDIAKALAAGASSVMMGRLFAGTEEASGELKEIQGRKYKFYAGARYTSLEHDSSCGVPELDSFLEELAFRGHRVEGVSGYVPYMGPAKALLLQIKRSLGVSLAFTGARTVEEFQSRARMIQISAAAFIEGRAHSIPEITHQNWLLGR
ncbi:IMP dehydrogenase [Polyangium sp. 15x6]|uniref:guanosine monophosphate reductase n=1 Tax=Polyangium sp. 15x6 TaxID=3042687 RepID=UPI00249A0EAC|nr:IMP dehydrogenase [Polyangium sp. 15x6]MDI3288165.1 IMP dehydrogenase [Polyangium sp. 15x6]